MTPLRPPPTNFIKTNIKIDNNVPLTSNKWSLWHYKPFNRTPLWGRAYVNISVVGLSLVFIANHFSKEHVEVAKVC